MNFVKQVSDPVWGAFPITDVEERILHTPELARLKQIKQLGLAFMDYSSLNHTRLEHSLGVMYVADRLYRILETTCTSLPNEIFPHAESIRLFNPLNRQAVRIAALLHDLGHPPFSHAVELTFKRFPDLLSKAYHSDFGTEKERKLLFGAYSHETFTEWIIKESRELRGIIVAHFSNPEMVDEIAELAVGRAKGALSPFNPIISGDLDADRIDYLIRDNRHSGFAIGLSPDELYGTVHMQRNVSRGKIFYEVIVDSRAIPFVNSVLSARNRLIRRVHLAPMGRTATQMLVTYLYNELNKYKDNSELAKAIVRIHSLCNDFTFFSEVMTRLSRGTQSLGEDIVGFLEGRSMVGLWQQFAHLDFIHMHPCLRLLVSIAASATYLKPDEQLFRHPDHPDFDVFVEPSSRPAPKFSLLVDYECNPGNPSLDFIAVAENEPGRAILWQALSNLDIFGYKVARPADMFEPNRLDGDDQKYVRKLREDQKLLARYAMHMANVIKKRRSIKTEGVWPSEFLLAILFMLSRYIAEKFPQASGVYVYRGEYFMNDFVDSLMKEPGFPVELRHGKGARSRLNVNRVFKELNRLEVYGLIETRRSSIFHSRKAGWAFRRTRHGIYSVRKDFRINAWGGHYVEREICEETKKMIWEVIRRRQERIRDLLQAVGRKYREAIERYDADVSADDRLESLERFHRDLEEICVKIRKAGGCSMIFALP